MYDYGLSVLSHYGLTASGTMRVRGALLCHTEQGDKLISEFGTAAEKLEQRYLLQCRITESGLLRCDQILRNEEGALATRGDDGGTYIVRNWYPGRECETGNSEDLIRASDALARLHTAAHLPVKMEYRRESLVEECIRHNVEIRKIRKYLQTKKKKNEFEKLLLASAGPYLEQGERAAAEMKASSYEKLRQRADEEGAVCHGEFSQHNILLENGRGETAVQSILYSVSNVIIQSAVNSLGTNNVAAWAAYGKVDGLFWMMINALGIAATTFVGQNYGAKKMDRVHHGVRTSMIMAFLMTGLMVVFMWFIGDTLISLFTTDTAVREICHGLIHFLVPTFFTYISIEILSGALRGVGDAWIPMFITGIGICGVRIVWMTAVLPHFHSLKGAAFCYPLSWVITTIAYFIYYLFFSQLSKRKELRSI